MKRYIYVLIAAVAVLYLTSSCNDYLEKTPDDDMTIEEVFSNPDWTRAWLANSYSWLPN